MITAAVVSSLGLGEGSTVIWVWVDDSAGDGDAMLVRRGEAEAEAEGGTSSGYLQGRPRDRLGAGGRDSIGGG